MSADKVIPEWLLAEFHDILEEANCPKPERQFKFKHVTLTVSDGTTDLVSDVTCDGVTMKRIYQHGPQ